MKIISSIFCLSIICLLSCTGNKESNIITYQLKRSDYVEKITVPGTVQAVINAPVMPPRSTYGPMTIVRLAKDGEFVKTGDTICVLSSPELESRYKEMLLSIENLEAELKKTEADNKLNIALLEAQLATSEAQLKISSLDSLKIRYATDIGKKLLELEMKKSLIEKQKTERKLAAIRVIGETDLKQKKVRILQEKTKAQGLSDQISSLTIVAKREGIVQRTISPVYSLVSTTGTGTYGGPIREGTVIFMNTPVLQFPDLSLMQISASVAEADFKRIEKGQKAILTVNAAKKLVITGKVNRKNLSGSAAQRYSPTKVKSYEVIIDVDSCHSKMMPGLSANCEILLNEVKDTLIVPTLSVFERDSINIVYVKDKKKFRPVKVETGTSGNSFTIIAGGLKGDEIIAITEPPNSLIVSETKSNDTINTHFNN